MTSNTNSSDSNQTDPNQTQECENCCCHQTQDSCQAPAQEPEIDYRDKYLRLLAESENLRRRLQKESQESIKFAVQKVVLEFLDPYDNFEKALYHAGYSPSEEVRNWAIGFKMIHQQFKDWLNSQGIHSFVSEGQLFNTQLHEAVEIVNSREVPEGYILKELSKGYKIHDRVLRPSKVTIAKHCEDENDLVDAAESDVDSQTSSNTNEI